MKPQFHISSILVFGALSVLLVLAILLGIKQVEGSSKAGSSLDAYPAPATQSSQSTKPVVTPKVSEPIKAEPTINPGYFRPTPVALKSGEYLYTDPESNYSFRYPSNTTLFVGRNAGNKYAHVDMQFKIANSSGGYQGMYIFVIDNPNGQSIENIIAEAYHSAISDLSTDTVKQAWTPLKVGNLDAFKTNFQPSMWEVSIFIPLKDRVVVMVPAHDTAVTAVDPKALDLFYQIVATFSIVP